MRSSRAQAGRAAGGGDGLGGLEAAAGAGVPAHGGDGEQTWRQLDEILAVISHDLRGPLSAINVAIDALGDGDLDPAMRDRYLEAMRRAIGRAERFLGDLLDVGRMEAGSFTVDPRPVPVGPLLEEAARAHERSARDGGNWVVLEIPEEVDRVLADRERLLQALHALIANALRYARGTGPITLRAERCERADGTHVRLWVCDRGPGLPHGQVERVFERPWRRHDERRTGAGLGLYIARGIAEAHGGTVSALSRPGDGARFCIELPAA